jgi:hypothetical protein
MEKYPSLHLFICSIMDSHRTITSALADVIVEAIRENRDLTHVENQECVKLLEKALILP